MAMRVKYLTKLFKPAPALLNMVETRNKCVDSLIMQFCSSVAFLLATLATSLTTSFPGFLETWEKGCVTHGMLISYIEKNQSDN
jgi:hypothetical protein